MQKVLILMAQHPLFHCGDLLPSIYNLPDSGDDLDDSDSDLEGHIFSIFCRYIFCRYRDIEEIF